MEPLLYLVHRIPFPPNKGDKIRSYHLLRHLAERYAVHLGTFVDMPEDLAHVPQLESLCASHHVETLDPRAGATAQRVGLPDRRGTDAAVLPQRRAAVVGPQRRCDSSGSARQSCSRQRWRSTCRICDLRVVLDFVDVDSAKWSEYAQRHIWPSSFVYRREGEKLLAFERGAAARSAASVFVTRGEADLFERLRAGVSSATCT